MQLKSILNQIRFRPSHPFSIVKYHSDTYNTDSNFDRLTGQWFQRPIEATFPHTQVFIKAVCPFVGFNVSIKIVQKCPPLKKTFSVFLLFFFLKLFYFKGFQVVVMAVIVVVWLLLTFDYCQYSLVLLLLLSYLLFFLKLFMCFVVVFLIRFIY